MLIMKRILSVSFALVVVALLQSGCGLVGKKTGKNGELTGVAERPVWDNPIPYGMLTIPAGSFHMGQNDQDVNYSQIAHNRQITISAFYMDETEVSNNEYRQFIQDMTMGTERYNDDIKDSVINFLYKFYAYEAHKHDGRWNGTGGDGRFKNKLDLSRVDAFDRLIYPDTLVWIRDFTYAYNEPLTENYWWHTAFDDYPVVGVNWYASEAFCNWRTQIYNKNREENGNVRIPRIRLPTEAEWEYAARGGFEHKIYPWEGPYIKNSRGCLFANYKPGRGDYIADNFEYTCPVKTYWPNHYGLYNMPGNVAEWCEDDFEETGYSYAHDLNPVYRDPKYRLSEMDRNDPEYFLTVNPMYPKIVRRRVIRGGSWKDIGYFLSVGTRTYEYADSTKSFIGFRCAMSVLGRSGAYGDF